MIKRKVAGILCALARYALASPLLAEPTKIAVGYVPAGDWLPSFVAKDKGFFDKRSLDVTLTRIALLPNIPPALVAGSLQIGVSTATTLLDAGLGFGSGFGGHSPPLSLGNWTLDLFFCNT